jgi:hypothetical protein
VVFVWGGACVTHFTISPSIHPLHEKSQADLNHDNVLSLPEFKRWFFEQEGEQAAAEEEEEEAPAPAFRPGVLPIASVVRGRGRL